MLLTVSMLLYSISMVAENIKFADPEVKRICIENWDTNGDGELSMEEAAAVTSIDGAFMGKEMITSFDELQFFTGLSDVGDYYKCHNLESLVIPDNVKSIGSYAFYECWHMYSLEIGNGVKYIHEGAFHATGLSSITFPNSLEYVGWDALTVTPWFTRHPDGKVYAGRKVLYCYKGTMPTNSRMDIEEGILGVTTNAFYGCSAVGCPAVEMACITRTVRRYS